LKTFDDTLALFDVSLAHFDEPLAPFGALWRTLAPSRTKVKEQWRAA